jgi:D-aminopeptidase
MTARPDARRARALGLACGSLPPGERNTIADIPGVLVGHTTISDGDVHTGVTAVLAHDGDIFQDKPVAAADVLNGFGNSIGMEFVNETGVIETPVLLTNTFSVGTCANALIRRAVRADPEIGRPGPTVHPVVLECNDGYLSDIQAMAVTEEAAEAAIDAAAEDFAVGAVGAGTGMSSYGFKSGIGSASRRLMLDRQVYHVGVLVLANFGRAGDLRLPDGTRMDPQTPRMAEAGSVVTVLATDVPLSHRQLRRVARRAFAGLAWSGSFFGHGSGDLVVAFTTANRTPQEPDGDILDRRVIAETRIDRLFQAAAEAVQESVMDSLVACDALTGRHSHTRPALADLLGRHR